MKRRKATRQQLKQHNAQLILRAIYEEDGISRAALAQETGLAKPTVSDIVSTLMDDGYVVEGERGSSTTSGGKRPRLLQFVAAARQIIAVSVSTERIIGCLAHLDGTLIAQHHVDLDPSLDAFDDVPVLTKLQYAINALMTQCDAPLLCLSVGVPGIVDEDRGLVVSSPMLNWHQLALGEHLQTLYNVPVYIANNTELAARARMAYATDDDTLNVVMVLVNHTIEIGAAFNGDLYHHGGEIAQLPLADTHKTVASLGWQAIEQRAQALVQAMPDSMVSTMLHDHTLTYLDIRHAANHDDAVACLLLDEIASALAHIYAWIIGLMRPDEIALAGSLTDLGSALTTQTRQHLRHLTSEALLQQTTLTLAQQPHLSMVGAVAYALHEELGIL